MKSATEWSKLHGEIGLDREDIGIRLQWIRAIQADALRRGAERVQTMWFSSAKGFDGSAIIRNLKLDADGLERGQEQEMK